MVCVLASIKDRKARHMLVFFLFLKLVQIDCIFAENVRRLYM